VRIPWRNRVAPAFYHLIALSARAGSIILTPPVWLYKNVFGLDLDTALPFGPKDGYSPFSALATFAIGQAAAVTAFAKGHDRLVVAVYAITVAITLLWIMSMLRAKRDEPIGTPPVPTPHRAYDKPTIRYARFTLTWTLILSVIISYLGFNLLLPNQTKRTDYIGDFKVNTDFIQNRRNGALASMPGEEGSRQALDVWVKWLANGENSTLKLEAEDEQKVKQAAREQKVPQKRLVWIEQRKEFTDNFKSLSGELKCSSSHSFGEKAAFLVKRDGSSPRPIYRQISFQINEQGGTSNRFELREPDAGEYLVILAQVHSKEGNVPAYATGYDIRIELDK
jgi:hypothetical protein